MNIYGAPLFGNFEHHEGFLLFFTTNPRVILGFGSNFFFYKTAILVGVLQEIGVVSSESTYFDINTDIPTSKFCDPSKY